MASQFKLKHAALLAVLFAGNLSVDAAEIATSAGTADGQLLAQSATSSESKPLQGGVQKMELSLEHLRDIGLDLKQVMTASRHLYDEVNIQPVSMITQPSMVGPGIIINIPVATRAVGPAQQPRKSRVDAAMHNMTPIIQTFKQNADDFVNNERELDVSADANAKLTPLLKDWIADVNQISDQLQQLEPLTQGPTFDNAAISSVCSKMQRTAQALDKVKGKAFKIIKKEQGKG